MIHLGGSFVITDLKTTIGYKCANCNRNNYKNISVFDLNKKQSVSLTCACGAHLGDIKYKNQDTYVIYAACCFCMDHHSFYIKKKNFWHDNKFCSRECIIRSYFISTCITLYIATCRKRIDIFIIVIAGI